jgi:succinyl-CoA synthetase beta subunit
MAKYLIDTTEVYRCDSESEAKMVIEEAKKTSTVAKYNCVYKERKQKGEVIDAWYRLTLTKVFDDEKEPMNNVEVIYDTEGSAF